RHLHPFPTRRSSDLLDSTLMGISGTDTHQSRRSVNTPENHYTRRRTRKLFPIGYRKGIVLGKEKQDGTCQQAVSGSQLAGSVEADRKSTRLNSSHGS